MAEIEANHSINGIFYILPVGTCKRPGAFSQRLRIIYVMISRSRFLRSKEYPLSNTEPPVMFEPLSRMPKQYLLQMKHVGFSLALSTSKNTRDWKLFSLIGLPSFLPLPTLILSLFRLAVFSSSLGLAGFR